MVHLLGEARRKCLPMSSTWDCLGLGADSLRKQADLSNDKEHRQAEIVPSLETMQAWLASASSADKSFSLNMSHSFSIPRHGALVMACLCV